MELIGVLVMIAGGIAAGVFALTAFALGRAEAKRGVESVSRDQLAASLLYQVLMHGGVAPDVALRMVRREGGLASRVTTSIDVTSWAQSYASASNAEDRHHLLEIAVQLAAAPGAPIPLRQYCALLDLNFGLGFQTDALARLREQYGFEYVDHAKNARPREADRGGGAAPLFVREQVDEGVLLQRLGLATGATRQQIISAYRHQVAMHHPDKVADKSTEAQDAAAARFIELTRAYEQLLALHSR